MKVPFVDLSQLHEPIQKDLHDVFTRVLDKSSFILGPEVSLFESAFADYLGASCCIALNSGTAALQLTLEAMGIGPGDEVITVPNTFIATAEAISAVGARPVFVDIDPLSFTMDPLAAGRAVTAKTKALLPVHLYGQSADLDPLLAICNRHGIALVEDACQAHGATYKGRKLGTIGVAGCFSFYPGKNLGCLGEGGAVVTSDPKIAERVRLLRDHGSTRKYEHSVPGYNFRMEGLQGGFLGIKLKHLDKWNERRRTAAQLYGTLLERSGVAVPAEMPYGKHVYHLYVVLVNDRDQVRDLMSAAGIETGLHYPTPLHLQKAYSELGYPLGSFPVTEGTAKRLLSLPMYPDITQEQIHHVVSVLTESVKCLAHKQQAIVA